MGFNLFVTKKMIMRRSRDEFKVKMIKNLGPVWHLSFFPNLPATSFLKTLSTATSKNFQNF